MMNKLSSRLVITILLCLILLSSLFPISIFASDEDVPSINSPSAILIDYDSGKILYEKNIYEKRYPASLTKIMTAIIVLEKCESDDIATVSYDAVNTLSEGYVTANLQVGEELTVEQLLYLLIVASANDAAIVLAEHVSGSIENFSVLMNEKAKELGCKNTHFVNPNGAHDENHYSTAYDLALMGRYVMQNDTFRTIASTTSYRLSPSSKYDKDDRYFTTTNALLRTNNSTRADNYYYKYATGIKTGFTTPAKDCLVASSEKDGLQFITVVLGAAQTSEGLSARYLDTLSLFKYGYNTYTIKEIARKGSTIQTINVSWATLDTKRLNIVIEEDAKVLIKKESSSVEIMPEVKLNNNLKAPIKQGDIVGTVTYHSEDIIYTYNLIASTNVESSKIFIIITGIVLVLFIFWLLTRIKKSNKKKKRNSKYSYKK